MPRGAPKSIPLLAKSLRAERLLQGLTLKDVENITGYSDSTINNAEKGLHNVSFDTILAYTQALGYELRLYPVTNKPILPTLPLHSTSTDG